MDEVRRYLDQPKLTCLLCGRTYALLSKHVNFAHDMDADSYKEMYGLPWSKALAGTEYREALGQRLRRTRALGKIPPAPPPEHIEKLRQPQCKRPLVEAVRRMREVQLRAMDRPPKTAAAPERMEEYLRRITTGRTAKEVARDEDMPCFQSFYLHCSDNPDYRRRFEAIWEQLPFAVQVRGLRTGRRFRSTVTAPRRSGKTWPEISEITGVKKSTLAHAWRRWEKAREKAMAVSS